MGRGSSKERISIADDDVRLREIEALALSGLLHTAHANLNALGGGQSLVGVRARCMMAWVAEHLGAGVRSRRQYVELRRQQPNHPSVCYFYTYLLLSERGPLEAILWLQQYQCPAFALPEDHAEIESLRARVYAAALDHANADRALARADPDALGTARWTSTRAYLLERRDRREEALEIVEEALKREPRHRLLVQHAAASLEELNRRPEALTLLERVEPLLEAPTLTSHRAAIEHELGHFEAEADSLTRLRRLLICADSRSLRSLSLRQAENAYRRGEVARALSYAEGTDDAYWKQLGDKLRLFAGRPVRRHLNVPVLVQDAMGCAPTSLAIISSYFGEPVDHVDVGDQICYEGTASHSERTWVEGRGWWSREFTVDFATTQALIERGVPFLLVTVSIASAHAQVVIGFDATRRTLLIRDPMTSWVVEVDADRLFERHRAYGPRGHVMLPKDSAEKISAVLLPDAELHDLAHGIRLALEENDRSRAGELCLRLSNASPKHPLSLWSARSIAAYDRDPYSVKACSERILEHFADDANAEISILDSLEAIGTLAERRARIEARLRAKGAPWVFYERMGDLLSADAAEHGDARRFFHRAHRMLPTRGRTIGLLAQMDHDRGDKVRALVENRAASTLEPTDDGLAWDYFEAAFRSGHAETALELLRDRVRQYRARSTGPSQVLFRALEWLERVDEAFVVLQDAIATRPQDPEGLSYAAEAHARYGRIAQAEELLAGALAITSSASVAQTAARIAELSSNLPLALERHLAVLAIFPLSLHSQDAATELIHELHGPQLAREHLAAVCEKYPTHCGLRELYCTWLRGHDPSDALPELEILLSKQPLHGWARRERALLLADLGRHPEAIEEAERACRMSPYEFASHNVLSSVLLTAGRRAEALEPAQRALTLAPDVAGAVIHVAGLADSLEQQHELLESVRAVVAQTSVDGSGILEWHNYAVGLVADTDLLAQAEVLGAERPGLWVGPHLIARYLRRAGRPSEAREGLEQAVERFPYLSRLQLDLAEACRANQDEAGELRALQRATQLSPSWTQASLTLADALIRTQDLSAAQSVLERGLCHHPRSADLKQALAKLFWTAGDSERAIALIRDAISFAPERHDGWVTYLAWSNTLGQGNSVQAYARQLSSDRPWNAYIWLRLAEVLQAQSENLACVQALEEALRRRPSLQEALDTYVLTLIRVGRKKDALEACERPVDGYHARGIMRARKAWVLWEYGERDAACAELARVLVDHPDQIWAHEVLTEWEGERGNVKEAVEVARALVLLAPLAPTSHGYLGAALKESGDLKGAWETFERAARLDPSYVYAAEMRMTLALQEKRIPDAELVLATQGPHLPPAYLDLLEVRLAVTAEDDVRALAAFGRMAKRATTPAYTLRLAADALANIPRTTLLTALGDLARQPDVAEDVGEHWVRLTAGRRSPPSALSILRLGRHNADTQRTAARAYFELAGDRTFSLSRVLLALFVLGGVARRHDDVWGKVGYALAAGRAYLSTQLWLHDYARRTNIESWMLHNYRIAALHNHQPQAALRAVEHALTLPADEVLQRHLAFAAFARAANGDVEGARQLTTGVTLNQLAEDDIWLFRAAENLVALEETPREDRRARLGELNLFAGAWVVPLLWPFSQGIIARWFAGGVIRQTFSLKFLLRRWGFTVVLAIIVYRVALATLTHRDWYMVPILFVALPYWIMRLRK